MLGLVFTEIGQEEVIKTDYYMGVSVILGINESVVGEYEDRFFEKYFRYTRDGVNWTEYITLNDFNIVFGITGLKPNHFFSIEYKYKRVGQDSNGDLILENVALEFEYEEVSIPDDYSKSFLSKREGFFSIHNINRTVNIINKLYGGDIVPYFVERATNEGWSDEDYLDFWFSVTHYFSILISFARDFENISFNKDTLNDYLSSEGLFLDKNRALDQLLYLQENLHDEFRRRGTLSVIETKGEYKGELLRIISKKFYDEFLFTYFEEGKSGWYINNTSPEYNNLSNVKNCNKSWENTYEVVDMFDYPLIGALNITMTTSPYAKVGCMRVKANTSIDSGIGTSDVAPETSKLILIDPRLDYEVTVTIELGSAIGNIVDANVNFGCLAYNQVFEQVDLLSAVDLTTQHNYFFNILDGVRLKTGLPVQLRGILFNKNVVNPVSRSLGIGYGRHLKFSGSVMKYICPFLTLSAGSNIPLYIYDVKVKPLTDASSRCYLGLKNNASIWVSNSSNIDEPYLKENITNKLLPYNLNTNFIYLNKYEFNP